MSSAEAVNLATLASDSRYGVLKLGGRVLCPSCLYLISGVRMYSVVILTTPSATKLTTKVVTVNLYTIRVYVDKMDGRMRAVNDRA